MSICTCFVSFILVLSNVKEAFFLRRNVYSKMGRGGSIRMLAYQSQKKGKRGVDRKKVEAALYELSNQIRRLDQKLTMKVENNISSQYYEKLNEIALVKNQCMQLEKNTREQSK